MCRDEKETMGSLSTTRVFVPRFRRLSTVDFRPAGTRRWWHQKHSRLLWENRRT